MYILDTDHMSVLERGGATALSLTLKLSALDDTEVATTIVSYEEQCKGWLARTARAKDEALQLAYQQLGQHLQIYAAINVLSFDKAAAAHFDTLQKAKVRVGTQDLKIAANDATLLTRNNRDFARIPNLKFDDWTI